MAITPLSDRAGKREAIRDLGDGSYAEVVVSAGELTLDSAGTPIDPDSMAHTFAYTGGNLTTDTATDGTSNWVKTFTYTNGLVTAESLWVKQ